MRKLLIAILPLLLLTGCQGNNNPTVNPDSGKTDNGGNEGDKTPTKSEFTVTFDLNYEGAPAATSVTVKKNKTVAEPSEPEREGYLFNGWFMDKAGENAFNFSTKIVMDMTVYASWAEEATGKTYVFEAEYAENIRDIQGSGYSGSATGTSMILNDFDTATQKYASNASNHYYVSFLYVTGISLDFTFTSDKAVNDATFIWRISGEVLSTINVNANDNTILVNGDALGYSDITITDIPTMSSGKVKEFEDYTLTTSLNIKEGTNTVKFVTTNADNSMGGTMYAVAPMIDCFKITTTANLTWDPDTTTTNGR